MVAFDKKVEYLVSNYVDTKQEKETKMPLGVHLVRFGFGTLGRVFPKTASKYAFKLFTTPRLRARHAVSDDVLESARLFEVMYGGIFLKCYEWGSGEKIVLLAHGWESRGTALRSFVPDLVKKGYKVVAFDSPAHGSSGGKWTTMPHNAGGIFAVMKHIGRENIHAVIAHSFGGSSTIFALSNLNAGFTLNKMVLLGVPSDIKKIITGFFKIVNVPRNAGKLFIEHVEKKSGMKIGDLHTGKMAQRAAINEALIIHDEKDNVVPISEAKKILNDWSNARMIVTHGLGHYRLVKNPDVMKKVVDFID